MDHRSGPARERRHLAAASNARRFTPAPDDGFRRGDARDHGVDGDAVVALLDAIDAQGFELNSFMLYRAGHVVAECWWWPYRPEFVHMMHSATKSFAGIGTVLATAEGLLSLDDPVLRFFPGRVARPSANLEAMTVEHLLTQTSGHAQFISGTAWRPIRTSWIDEFFKVPVVHPPGSEFVYSSATSFMLSAIVSQVTGAPMYDYLRPRLFEPMAMHSLRWDMGPENISPGGNGLSCTTSDLLKLGVLLLDKGKWQGRELLPAHLAEAIALPRHGNLYGYQWWVMPDGLGYFAGGKFGQFAFVFPGLDAVLTTTASIPDGQVALDAFYDIIFGHMPRICAGGGGAAANRNLLARADAAATPAPLVPRTSIVAPSISGRTFLCDPNEDGVRSIRLTFGTDRCEFEMVDGRGTHVVTCGTDDWLEGETTITGSKLHHEYEPAVSRVVAGGRWVTPFRFEMTWHFVETSFRDTVCLHFRERDGEVRFDRFVNVNSGTVARPPVTGWATP